MTRTVAIGAGAVQTAAATSDVAVDTVVAEALRAAGGDTALALRHMAACRLGLEDALYRHVSAGYTRRPPARSATASA